ncbi:hypothetical protein AVEN_41881-1 [Araneus ventricosus]|uniref:Uncharacterized protein n=1 Tax=Araneus ventricosus TaxID=182803 RepID=A0A4Y2ACK4_ARAVE|nr:hypothetical protein AVEN_41881-1 [Araneus ventricosus]
MGRAPTIHRIFLSRLKPECRPECKTGAASPDTPDVRYFKIATHTGAQATHKIGKRQNEVPLRKAATIIKRDAYVYVEEPCCVACKEVDGDMENYFSRVRRDLTRKRERLTVRGIDKLLIPFRCGCRGNRWKISCSLPLQGIRVFLGNLEFSGNYRLVVSETRFT